ncbi:ADP-dependent glucokinase [Cololabis saira]|uniref:ADP-dependent glucokinase n=1 Tax=Cololabis saira TaxID=129043 RepID=UPI002AD39D4E|nr:ADP-dependent glucokinase [Cololabis saira]
MEGGGGFLWMKYGSLVSLLVLVLALWSRSPQDAGLDDRLDLVLSSLLRAESKVGINDVARPKVAIGFGGCVDLIVDGVSYLNKIGISQADTPVHHDYLENAEQLAQSFAYFFAPGAAAERFMINETLFSELVESARDSPGNRWAIGGNAPVMAGRMATEGCDVLLGGSFSPEFTEVLSKHITVAGEVIEEPDIHLILEYSSGTSWGRFTSRRANRYIIHSDDHNPYLTSMDEFAEKLQDFKPDLLIVGGLQMMDNFPYRSGERDDVLSHLADLLSSSSPHIGTHFEMASFVEESIMQDLLNYVIPHADSLGMNEQELPNLLSLLKGSNITVLSDPNPRVATVLDQMREVYRILNQRSKDPAADGNSARSTSKPLTRLHVHTLAFQAMIVTRDSQWKNTMSAIAKASLTANRHVCGSNDIDPSKARLIMDDSFSVSRREGSQRILLQETRPVNCWDEEDYEICVAPVLVCTEVYQTAGGGDNISAAGLVLQI